MKSFFAEVQRIAEKTCFVSIPAQIVDTLARDHSKLLATLELKWSAPLQREGVAHGRDTQDGPSYGTRSVLVSWSGGSSLAHDRLEVPASLAECLGLPDGVRVETVIRRDIEQASRIDVEPVAHDDWEIIELHAEHLEEQLLNQVPEQHWMLACARQTCSPRVSTLGPRRHGRASAPPLDQVDDPRPHFGDGRLVRRQGRDLGAARQRRGGGHSAAYILFLFTIIFF